MVGRVPAPDLRLVRRAVTPRPVALVRALPGEPLPRGDFDVIWRLFQGRGAQPDQFLEALREHPEVRWVHTVSAGVDHLADVLAEHPDLILTHSAGAVARPIAEFVVGCLLQHCKRAEALRLQQLERRYHALELRELGDLRVVVMGLGAIGGQLAALLVPFGATVIGVRKHPERPVPVGVSQVFPGSELEDACRGADALVLAAPLTADTRHGVSARELAALAPDSVLINVARGALLDTGALGPALASGRPVSAFLDAFEQEPLPEDSPLWAMPGVHVSPHLSWSGPNYSRRSSELFADQLRRWLDGEELRNRVALSEGY